MSLANLTSYGALGTSGFSSPVFEYSAGSKAVCVAGTLSIPVVGETTNILSKAPANNFELTELITDFTRRNSDTVARYSGEQVSVSTIYDIYAKLCVPTHDTKKTDSPTAVQFLSHGGTLDLSYWDFAEGYSYIDAAAEQGFASFAYDRLGSGRSEHPDAIQAVQVPLQVDLAHALIQQLRNGDIGNMAFEKVVGVGHSLGSALTQSLTARYPEDLDAAILTGHSAFFAGAMAGFASAGWQIAKTLSDRPELGELPNGYFAHAAIPQALQFSFYYYPHFDEKIFFRAMESRGCNAIGETLTLTSVYVPATDYAKPVLVLNGQQDYFYCQGNCLAPTDVTAEALAVFFPNALKDVSQAVTLPNIGHNINFHLGRQEAFDAMLKFLAGAGIKA
ncbi:Alpha/Beta hydrolase protein [Massariosphaeria phaeospora]|uniref:Alpha/Beta hydrolase protein n=1 Tax=Massariosphaeria phaeospora TaxID=100035 RepID=A0A7C8I2M3_9PLEO|nr:Alpha/Beta hydrolase protein [Massariosphaeria phaeospora]